MLVSKPISEVSIAPADGSLNLFSVRVEQKLVMIKAVTLRRSIRAEHPITIKLTRTHFRQVAVPDHIGLLRKWNAKQFTLSRRVEQTELHFLGVLGVKGEVDALAIPG